MTKEDKKIICNNCPHLSTSFSPPVCGHSNPTAVLVQEDGAIVPFPSKFCPVCGTIKRPFYLGSLSSALLTKDVLIEE